jgi:DNA (cytosine-5)-methyltransferase 1
VNYYNDNNPYAADWLRSLIAEGLIPSGDVDERSIVDVKGPDLDGYTQHHFFAGIGGWPLALQLAGWPSTRPVFTGSCPCQPFSTAGKGDGESDERHLWPEFRRLISECRPDVVFGEQVASQLGRTWSAGVRADLESLAYAVGVVDISAASLGAPHIRQRLYWVADSSSERCGEGPSPQVQGDSTLRAWEHAEAIDIGELPGRPQGHLYGGARRIEPGLLPLVDGVPFRLADGRSNEAASRPETIRGLGNAIVPPVAAAFIRAYME